MLFLVFIWLFWGLVKRTHSRLIYLLFFACLILSVLYLDGFFTSRTDWLSDFSHTISSYRRDSTFLPYRVRPWIFNSGILPIYIIGRTFSYFWLDWIFSLFGIGTLYLLISGIGKFPYKLHLIAIFGAIFAGSLAHHPNPTGFYLLLLPLIHDLVSPVLRGKSAYFWLLIIMLNLIGQIK